MLVCALGFCASPPCWSLCVAGEAPTFSSATNAPELVPLECHLGHDNASLTAIRNVVVQLSFRPAADPARAPDPFPVERGKVHWHRNANVGIVEDA